MSEAASSEPLTDLRLALHRHGYRPVPVAGAHLAMKSAGKRPLMKGWETICATADEDEIARWTLAQRNCTNTGLLCGEIVGVDIDVPVETLAAEIEGLARKMLGATPLKRIGSAPKLLLTFRAERVIDKIQTPELLLPNDAIARVEVLATGQQFVAFGIHPGTKSDYVWPDRSPLEVTSDQLPAVAPEHCTAFIAQAEALLRQAGGESRVERRQIERQGRKVAGLGRNEPPSREIVAEALAHIPNDDLPYDEWIRVGLSLYSALGSEGRDLWEAWSAQSSKNAAAYTADKWESFAGVRSISVGTLFWLAGQNVWERARPQHSSRRRAVPEETAEPVRDSKSRPTIRILAGQLPRVINEGEKALIAANLGLYQRGSLVVRPTLTPVANADGRWTLAPRLVHVRAHHIAEAMTLAANWLRFDGRICE